MEKGGASGASEPLPAAVLPGMGRNLAGTGVAVAFRVGVGFSTLGCTVRLAVGRAS